MKVFYLILLIPFVFSCSKEEKLSISLVEPVNLTKSMVIHDKIKKDYDKYESFFVLNNEKLNKEFLSTYEKNLLLIENLGIKSLFNQNNINENIVSFSQYYFKNENRLDLYTLLEKERLRLNIVSDKDIYDAFNYIEIIKRLENKIYAYDVQESDMKEVLPFYSRVHLSSDCVEAVVGSLIASVGAIGVSGPVGLGIFLVSKSYATYQMIKACT